MLTIALWVGEMEAARCIGGVRSWLTLTNLLNLCVVMLCSATPSQQPEYLGSRHMLVFPPTSYYPKLHHLCARIFCFCNCSSFGYDFSWYHGSVSSSNRWPVSSSKMLPYPIRCYQWRRKQQCWQLPGCRMEGGWALELGCQLRLLLRRLTVWWLSIIIHFPGRERLDLLLYESNTYLQGM